MRLTRLAFFAALWVACVGAVATAAWYAIDSAGRQVQVLSSSEVGRGGGSGTPVALPTSATTDDEAQDPAPRPTSGSSGTSPSAKTSTTTSAPSSRTTSDDTGNSTPDAGRTSSRSRSPRSTSSSSPRTTTSSRPAPDPGTSQPSSKTVVTGGGSVTFTCTGTTMSDYQAKPADGWAAQTNQQGADRVDVKFSEEGDQYEVQGRCVDGRPDTSVIHRGDD